MLSRRHFVAMAIGLVFSIAGLSSAVAQGAGGKVVIYSSIDDPYVRPLVKRFERNTGIQVTLNTDSEATKTAGLVERIEAEKDNPRADVYWGNEIFHTLRLAEQGVFAAYRSPVAKDIPDRWRDKDGLYTDIGLRARMIVFPHTPAVQGQCRQDQDAAG